MSVPDGAMRLLPGGLPPERGPGHRGRKWAGSQGSVLPADAEGQPPHVAAGGHLCLKVERAARVEP